MAPIFEDGNNKKDRPREGDLFETRSLVLLYCIHTWSAGHGGFYRTMFGINSIYSLRTPNSTFFPSKCSKRAFLTECWPR